MRSTRLLLAVAALALAAAGCRGSGSTPKELREAHAPAADTAVPSTKPAPPAAPVVPLTRLPPPASLDLPPGDLAGAALGGPPNTEAARGLADALRSAGLDPSTIRVDVLPFRNATESLAIFSIDATKPNAPSSDVLGNIGSIIRLISAAPSVRDANITRLAVSVRGRDKDGVSVFTLTIPMTVVDALANGQATLSQPEYAKQVVYEIKRVAQ